MSLFTHKFTPKTKVQIRSTIIGGIAGGTIYQLVQFPYITFQIGALKAGAIYGSFVGLPPFLVQLQNQSVGVLFVAFLYFGCLQIRLLQPIRYIQHKSTILIPAWADIDEPNFTLNFRHCDVVATGLSGKRQLLLECVCITTYIINLTVSLYGSTVFMAPSLNNPIKPRLSARWKAQQW